MELQLARNLKILMKRKGINLTRLSKETGIPKQTLHNWLCGARPVKFEQVMAVGEYFGFRAEILLIGDFRDVDER
jgi:transcriptional regulator with XRE-family HTH domain